MRTFVGLSDKRSIENAVVDPNQLFLDSGGILGQDLQWTLVVENAAWSVEPSVSSGSRAKGFYSVRQDRSIFSYVGINIIRFQLFSPSFGGVRLRWRIENRRKLRIRPKLSSEFARRISDLRELRSPGKRFL